MALTGEAIIPGASYSQTTAEPLSAVPLHLEFPMRVNRLIGVAAVLAIATPLAAQSPPLKWGPAPAVFPAGAKMAVLQGDPSKTQLFTVRLDIPKGYRVPPHFHPTDEH